MTQRGIFITLEGGEGVGKSTQAKLLQRALTRQGINVIATREPGGTPEAERIRDILVQNKTGVLEPLTEALLLSAARHEHIVRKIRPALERGEWVISDRFLDSTRAMQGHGMGLNIKTISSLYKMIAGELKPDITFIFNLDPVEGVRRSTKRLAVQQTKEDRYERMGSDFHVKLHKGFLKIAKDNPDRCVIIDASKRVGTIHKEIMEIVNQRFPLKEVKHD
jgi:dTMP kinase